MQRGTLLHLHILKTAGTTLYTALLSRIPSERVLLSMSESFAEELTPRIADMDLVSGHLTWSAVRAFAQPPLVLTVLRDATERALSMYSYLKENAAAGVFEPKTQRLAEEAATRPLADVLLDRTSALREIFTPVQVAYLSSDEPNLRRLPFFLTPTGDLDVREVERHLEASMRNLAACGWVSTLETLDRDLETLARCLDWAPFGVVVPQNVTRNRQRAESLPLEARRELERLGEADRDLHAYAGALAAERHASI